LNGATLGLYSGTQPSTPETALAGNVLLASFTFSNPAFSVANTSASGQNVATATFTSVSATPGNNGTASFARATINYSGGWQAATAYNYGTIINQNSKLYVCCKAGTSAASGGPGASTGMGIVDGGAGWNQIGTTGSPTYADFSIGVGAGADIILGNLTLNTSTPVTISSFALQMPCL
jgi:hypothetical protein